MAGLIAIAPKRIVARHVRDFNNPAQRFAGTSIGITGEPDVGLHWFSMFRFITEELGTTAGDSCAYILNRGRLNNLTNAVETSTEFL